MNAKTFTQIDISVPYSTRFRYLNAMQFPNFLKLVWRAHCYISFYWKILLVFYIFVYNKNVFYGKIFIIKAQSAGICSRQFSWIIALQKVIYPILEKYSSYVFYVISYHVAYCYTQLIFILSYIITNIQTIYILNRYGWPKMIKTFFLCISICCVYSSW